MEGKHFNIRMQPGEKAALKAQADEAGVSMAHLLKACLWYVNQSCGANLAVGLYEKYLKENIKND